MSDIDKDLFGEPAGINGACPRDCDNGWIRQSPGTSDETAYPCPRCRPETFEAWAAGHYQRDHDSSRCGRCAARADTTRKRR